MPKNDNIIKLNPELLSELPKDSVQKDKKSKDLEPAIYVTTLSEQAVVQNENLSEIQYMVICEEYNVSHSGEAIGRVLLIHNHLYGEVRVIVESFTETHLEVLFHTYQQTLIKKVESGDAKDKVIKYRELHVIYTTHEGLPVFEFEVSQMKPNYNQISIGVKASFPMVNRLLLKRLGALYT